MKEDSRGEIQTDITSLSNKQDIRICVTNSRSNGPNGLKFLWPLRVGRGVFKAKKSNLKKKKKKNFPRATPGRSGPSASMY